MKEIIQDMFFGLLRKLILVAVYFGLCLGGAWVWAHIYPSFANLIDPWPSALRIIVLIIVFFGWPCVLLIALNWMTGLLNNEQHHYSCICEEFLEQLPSFLLGALFFVVYIFSFAIMVEM